MKLHSASLIAVMVQLTKVLYNEWHCTCHSVGLPVCVYVYNSNMCTFFFLFCHRFFWNEFTPL